MSIAITISGNKIIAPGLGENGDNLEITLPKFEGLHNYGNERQLTDDIKLTISAMGRETPNKERILADLRAISPHAQAFTLPDIFGSDRVVCALTVRADENGDLSSLTAEYPKQENNPYSGSGYVSAVRRGNGWEITVNHDHRDIKSLPVTR